MLKKVTQQLTKVIINYVNYESKIVKQYSIELTRWPLDSPVQNSLQVSGNNAITLKLALEDNSCHWVKLSPTKLATKKALNKVCQKNNEWVYVGKQTTKKRKQAKEPEEDNEEDNV